MRKSPFRARGRTLAASLVATLIAGLIGILGAQQAQATLGDRPAWTFNLQGTTSNGQSAWTNGVGSLLATPNAIVAIQEAGPAAPPQPVGAPPAQIINGQNLAALPAGINGVLPAAQEAQRVVHTQWVPQVGGAYDVYFLQTDQTGFNNPNPTELTRGRVNIAIVTPRPADQVVIIPNPLPAGRAALGVRLGTTWFFSLHALSGSGNDGPGLLRNIRSFLRAQPGGALGQQDALVLGDFNRVPTPANWTPAQLGAGEDGEATPNSEIVTQGSATQRSGNVLDYGIMVDLDRLFPQNMTATFQPVPQGVNPFIYSDHRPVQIGPNPQSPTTPLVQSSTVAVENMQSGGVLDAANDGTANFTPLDSFQRKNAGSSGGNGNQGWTRILYPDGSLSLKGQASGRCIDITNSTSNPGQGTPLSLFDCADQLSQRWMPVSLGDDEYQFQSLLLPSMCMNIAGGQTNPATATNVVLFTCANAPGTNAPGANERFIFTPWAAATGPSMAPISLSATTPSPTALENLHAGGIMDVANNATAINTPVISWVRQGTPNEGWHLTWSNGTASLQSTSANRCLDILNSTSATAGRAAVIFDCTGQPSQTWKPVQLDNGTVQFESQLNSSLCLDINGATGAPTTGNVDVNTCNDSDTQQWMFTAFDPTGVPVRPTDPDDSELFTTPAAPSAPVPAQRVAYFPSWSIYANSFMPKNLDTQGIAGKLTTLNYAFENIDPVNLTCMAANKASTSDESSTTGNDGSSDAWADYQRPFAASESVNGTADAPGQPLMGNFNQLKELKAKYPNLKIDLSIGGWTYSKFFSDAAATDASRKKFVSSCINMYIKGNLPILPDGAAGGTGVAANIFDGFDIDWEFPGSNSGHLGNHVSAQDGANYTALLAEFRNELDALGGKHYQLTAALPAGPSEIGNLGIQDLAKVLDLGDVMTYDFHGAFEAAGPTNFQAPLYDSPNSPAAGTKFTANDAITNYLQHGFPAAKLTLGVPFYGRGWTGVPDGGQHGRYQTVTGPTASFPFSQEPGVADYKELQSAGLTNANDTFFDTQTESSWIYDGTNFWSIETPTSLAYKRQYIQQMGLGGVMMYSLEADDSSSTMLNAATGSGAPVLCGKLAANGTLTAGQSLSSCNGTYKLAMQGDGNLVLYHGTTGIWSTGTSGSAAVKVVMQGDGNLVLYSSSGSPLWNSGTAGNAGASLTVQGDGDVVINSASGTALWDTGTTGK
jgi:GH18 family chitinase